jgi:hypothetical protein
MRAQTVRMPSNRILHQTPSIFIIFVNPPKSPTRPEKYSRGNRGQRADDDGGAEDPTQCLHLREVRIGRARNQSVANRAAQKSSKKEQEPPHAPAWLGSRTLPAPSVSIVLGCDSHLSVQWCQKIGGW